MISMPVANNELAQLKNFKFDRSPKKLLSQPSSNNYFLNSSACDSDYDDSDYEDDISEKKIRLSIPSIYDEKNSSPRDSWPNYPNENVINSNNVTTNKININAKNDTGLDYNAVEAQGEKFFNAIVKKNASENMRPITPVDFNTPSHSGSPIYNNTVVVESEPYNNIYKSRRNSLFNTTDAPMANTWVNTRHHNSFSAGPRTPLSNVSSVPLRKCSLSSFEPINTNISDFSALSPQSSILLKKSISSASSSANSSPFASPKTSDTTSSKDLHRMSIYNLQRHSFNDGSSRCSTTSSEDYIYDKK